MPAKASTIKNVYVPVGLQKVGGIGLIDQFIQVVSTSKRFRPYALLSL